MHHLLNIFIIITIQFITNTENFVIRTENLNRKREAKNVNSSNQFSELTLQNNQQYVANIERKDSESSDETSDDLSMPPHYKFSYKVFNPETGDDKEHKEERDGDLVQGEYSLVEPDGSRRTVTYISNGTDGFNAIIKRTAPPKANFENINSNKNYLKNDQTAPLEINVESEIKPNINKTLINEASNNIKTNSKNFNTENFEISQISNKKISNTEIDSQQSYSADNDTVLWFSSKTEYLSPDIMRENNSESPQLNVEESQNYKVVATNPNSPPTHFITYSLIVPQAFYTPTNINEKTLSQKDENKTKIAQTKTKKTRNVQRRHGNEKRRHH